MQGALLNNLWQQATSLFPLLFVSLWPEARGSPLGAETQSPDGAFRHLQDNSFSCTQPLLPRPEPGPVSRARKLEVYAEKPGWVQEVTGSLLEVLTLQPRIRCGE